MTGGMVFFWLVFAHLMGDFVLQTDFLAKLKGKCVYILLVHVFLWTGTVAAALLVFGLFAPWKLAMLFVGHAVCDWLKARVPEDRAQWWHLYPDQAFHGLQLGIAWMVT
jgi:hypothetical protein